MHIYDVIVIGAGPAGIAASAYANRLGLDTLLVYTVFGGQLNYTHKLYSVISASDNRCDNLICRYYELVKKIDKKQSVVTQIQKDGNLFAVKENGFISYSKTVIVCSGRRPYKPKVVGYNGTAQSFLDYPYLTINKEDDVLIIGGGYTGLDICEILSPRANSIIVVEKSCHLGGNKERQSQVLQKPNVAFFMDSIAQFADDKQGLASIVTNDKEKRKEVQFSKLFTCIGTCPNTDFIDNNLLGKGKEFIVNTEHCQRKYENMSPFVRGLYAAGDVIDRPITGYAAIAEGSGLESAIAAYNYLLDSDV